jgi:hypothetical protein
VRRLILAMPEICELTPNWHRKFWGRRISDDLRVAAHLLERLPHAGIGSSRRFLILPRHQLAVLREREGRFAVPEA